jgi:hypothetical protein
MTLALDLSTPIITHDGPLKSLPLARPTLGMLTAAGAPFTITQKISDDGSLSITTKWDFQAVAALLSAMAKVDELVLAEMDGKDVLAFTDMIFALLRGEA